MYSLVISGRFLILLEKRLGKCTISAAHCIQRKNSLAILSPQDLVVLLGAYNITAMDQSGTVKANVTEIHVHPEWDPYFTPTYDADVAILVLSHSISFTKYIRPICIPTDSTHIDSATIDINGTIIGWGLSKNTNLNDVPRQASIQALNDTFCYKVDSGMASFSSSRTFCGGVGDGIPELGDSGGGFYVFSKNAWVQYGIVSGIRTNETGHVIMDSFSIYTNVKAFRKWILDTVRQTGVRVNEELKIVLVTLQCLFNRGNTLYSCVIDDLDIKEENALAAFLDIYVTPKEKNTGDVEVFVFRSGSVITFPIGLGAYFPNVTDIHVASNFSMSLITRPSLQYLENLEKLSINSRKLDLIDEDSFWDLPNLILIVLENTTLKTIDERVFERSENLREIRLLSNEQLESLPRNLLEHNLKLETIAIIGNSLKVIDEEMFQFNSNVSELALSNNRLESIPEKLFRNNSQLQVVDISHNFLQTLHEKTFKQNPQLTTVILSYNQLEFLPWNIFEYNLLLAYVDLQHNFLRIINEKIFERNSGLRSVFLTSNRLDLLPRNLFRSNSLLVDIDLSSNKLDSLPVNLFNGNVELEMVDLSNNSIVEMDQNIFKTNTHLTSVNLSSNKIEQISENFFASNSRLKEINFDDNLLNRIDIDFTKFESVEKISFYNNSCVNAMYNNTTDKFIDFQVMLSSNCTAIRSLRSTISNAV